VGLNVYYTYILKLNNKKYYSGFSTKLKKRIQAHQLGNVPQTTKFRPLKLVFYAAFNNKFKALEFEKYLKSSSGFAFRNKRFI
jgi:putative endonuclease